YEPNQEFAPANQSLIMAAAVSNPLSSPEFTEAYNLLNDMVTAYNDNIIVQYQNEVTLTSEYTGEPIPMNLYLFDSILSINYDEEQIAFRAELAVYGEVAAKVLNSDFFDSQNLSDITGDDIRDIFDSLANSHLLTSVIPVAIEVAADYFGEQQGINIDIPVDNLYAIEWDTEIMQLGEIAATAFELVNAAGAFVEGVDLNTITLDGDVVNTLFTELGQSDLITLSAYVALEPILEIAGTTIQAVITVPDNFSLDDWEGEFRAIGALAGEVLNTGLTIGDVESGDVMALLSVLSDVDFTILLDSQIVTQALINILSGAIPDLNLSQYIVIPDDIVWLDTDDGMGGTIYGELHNILTALNTIIDSVPDFNLENLDLSVIADLNPDDIVTIFNSRVLVATITDYVKNKLNFGDSFNLVLPDSVFDGVDGGGYLLQEELEAIVRAAHTIFSELACEATDDACGEMGFDMNGILTLGGDDIDT
ncbi:MAG TPA: hypothetical protein PKU69_04095, partial [Bacillota bacterium]|nr:hypothetical protein [Bacillota bacterium]